MYSSAVIFVPVTRSQQVSPQRREKALVDRRRNRGGGGGSPTSDSPSSSDLPSKESEPDGHQCSSSHAEPSCLFCSILRRCSTNWQNPPPRRRHWTADMHGWSELHRSKTFFSKLKKIEINISSWCPGEKESIRVGFKVGCPRIAEIQGDEEGRQWVNFSTASYWALPVTVPL